MDWQTCLEEMREDISVETQFLRVHGDPDIVARRSRARARLIEWLVQLARIGSIGDIERLVAIELMFLEYEARVSQDRPARLASINAALEQLEAVLYHAGLLLSPRKYQELNRQFSPSRHRAGEVPLDIARLALRSHLTRLNNEMAATRGPDEELRLLASRQAVIKNIQRLYIAGQRQALGLPPAPATPA